MKLLIISFCVDKDSRRNWYNPEKMKEFFISSIFSYVNLYAFVHSLCLLLVQLLKFGKVQTVDGFYYSLKCKKFSLEFASFSLLSYWSVMKLLIISFCVDKDSRRNWYKPENCPVWWQETGLAFKSVNQTEGTSGH
jgi:hypothetical protein